MSSFDSIVKMLELNTDNNVTFVSVRLNSDNLKVEFENMKYVFPAKLNELDLIKLKIPSESEMCGIIAGERSLYDKIIQERFYCLLWVAFLLQNHFNIFIFLILNV